MVVGTDIEQLMVLPVVPADQGPRCRGNNFIGRNRSVQAEILLDLRQEPASRRSRHGLSATLLKRWRSSPRRLRW